MCVYDKSRPVSSNVLSYPSSQRTLHFTNCHSSRGFICFYRFDLTDSGAVLARRLLEANNNKSGEDDLSGACHNHKSSKPELPTMSPGKRSLTLGSDAIEP